LIIKCLTIDPYLSLETQWYERTLPCHHMTANKFLTDCYAMAFFLVRITMLINRSMKFDANSEPTALTKLEALTITSTRYHPSYTTAAEVWSIMLLQLTYTLFHLVPTVTFLRQIFKQTLFMVIAIPRSRPPLWSSGQSSWLQIQRPGYDSQRYQIF
jgi:hypothetical protein